MSLNKQINEIKKNGYIIIPNVLKKNECNKIASLLDKIEIKKLKENDNYFLKSYLKGQVVLRDIVCYDKKLLKILIKDKIYNLVNSILGDQFILDGATGSRPIKTSNKYPSPHIDSHLPINTFNQTLDIVLQVCIDDFKEKNGSTFFWKKSHLSGVRCQNIKTNFKKYKKVKSEAKKGSVIAFLGQTWHQLGKNQTNERRWGILFHLKRWWIKPSSNYSMYFKNDYKKFTKKEKMILGFSSISPLPLSDRIKTKIDLKNLPNNLSKI